MKLPASLFIGAVEEKKIYFFSSNTISTTGAHYFICIKRTPDDILIFSCCTSQFEKRKRFIESRGISEKTLVFINPKDTDNPFTVDTYVDCNTVHKITVDDFRKKYETELVEHSGEIDDVYYEQILLGIHESDLIEEEIKKIIPKELE